MKTSIIILLSMIIAGCEIDRVNPASDPGPPSLITVSCCKKPGTSIWPDSVPESHRSYCLDVKKKNAVDFVWPGNVVYLATSVDCGNGHHDIGDEFYPK